MSDRPNDPTAEQSGDGQHVDPHAEHATPEPKYDPMTGKRIKQPKPEPTGPIFDPITGKRLVKRQRPTWLVPVLTAALVVLVVTGVGGGIWWHQHQQDQERAAARAASEARAQACTDELEPVHDALVAVDGRMDTGANVSQFGDIVGAAASAYNAVDAGVVADNDCALYGPLGEVVQMYGAIYSGWNDCIFESDYCDPDYSIDVGGALVATSHNLDSLGSDMSLTGDPSSFSKSVRGITNMVDY